MEIPPELKGYFTGEGVLILWPSRSRREAQQGVLKVLASQFEPGRRYRETEVNAILKAAHAFEDHALLRRELVVAGLLFRMPDGGAYWRP